MSEPTIEIILASRSPRRQQLLEAAEIPFRVMTADVDETPPADLPAVRVPEFLAKKKAGAISEDIGQGSLIIAADTLVLLKGEILGKPKDLPDACRTLEKLSGEIHDVITGVCIKAPDKEICFSVVTQVHFRKLTGQQIIYYVNQYRPFDKAGAYAIQEWIGMIGIEKIHGDYYNVMGLPIGEVVRYLAPYLPQK